MGVLQFPIAIPATVGTLPSLKFMVTTDDFVTITEPGYLNSANIDAGNPIAQTDIVMVLYDYDPRYQTGTIQLFTVTINVQGVITLVLWYGGVVLPVTPNDIAVFYNTNGAIYDPSGTPPAGGVPIFHDGPIVSGKSGSNTGSFIVQNGTPHTGVLVITVSENPGDITINFVALPMAQNTNILIPDPGTSMAHVLLDEGTNTLGVGASIIANKVNGTESSNAVTANGMAGVITTSSLTTTGGSSYTITWTNSFITSTSVVLLTIAGGTNTTENITLKCVAGASTATLTIYNNTAATALNGTVLINYLVF